MLASQTKMNSMYLCDPRPCNTWTGEPGHECHEDDTSLTKLNVTKDDADLTKLNVTKDILDEAQCHKGCCLPDEAQCHKG